MAKTGAGPIGYSCVKPEKWHYAEWQGGEGKGMLFATRNRPNDETRNSK